MRHRYVHGGFADTETRFSIYLPPADLYEGRFFQHITPVPDSEYLAQEASGEQDKIGFSISSGGYFLETNGGGASGRPGSSVDPTIAAYRANAAAAQYSRVVAARHVRRAPALRLCLRGEWRRLPHHRERREHLGRLGRLRALCHRVADGHSEHVHGADARPADPARPLRPDRRCRRAGWERRHVRGPHGGGARCPRRGDPHGLPAAVVVRAPHHGDARLPGALPGPGRGGPTYFDEFWTEPGYLGTRRPPRCCATASSRLRHRRTSSPSASGPPRRGRRGRIPVRPRRGRHRLARARGPARSPVAVRLSGAPRVDVRGADLYVLSGAAAGARIGLLSVIGDIAVFGPGGDGALALLQPGDTVRVDNSGYLAAETYHRHQVPRTATSPSGTSSGTRTAAPLYPQRPSLLGPSFAAAAAGTVQTGRFEGKMIVVESLLDREALPWQADWYRSKVREHFGERGRRALPSLVHRQRPARRRRGAGEPAAHGELPRRAAPGAP